MEEINNQVLSPLEEKPMFIDMNSFDRLNLMCLAKLYQEATEYYEEHSIDEHDEYNNFIKLEGSAEDKVKAYQAIMNQCDSNNDVIDKEIERLKKRKESNKKLKDRLSKVLIKVTDEFGIPNKSGNNVLEYNTVKLIARNNKRYEFDKELYSIIVEMFKEYYLSHDAMTFSLDMFIEHIQDNIINKYESRMGYKPLIEPKDISKELLQFIGIKINMNTNINSIFNMFAEKMNVVNILRKTGEVIDATKSTELKQGLSTGCFIPTGVETINKTLNIK